jgi:hypothetical protein
LYLWPHTSPWIADHDYVFNQPHNHKTKSKLKQK